MLKVMKLKDYATLLGTFCGVSAIIIALPPIRAYRGAMMLICFGVVADLLDGFVARRTGGGNAFGVELDSLSDAIVFGVAPAVVSYMIYATGRIEEGMVVTDMNVLIHHPVVMLIAGFLLVAAGIARLAYFNITEDKGIYLGMPIPTTASALILFMMTDYFASLISWISPLYNQIFHWALPVIIIGLAWCNVTTKIRYGKDSRKKSGAIRYFLILGFVGLFVQTTLVLFFRYVAAVWIFFIFWFYLILFIWYLIIGLRWKNKENLHMDP